MQVNDHYVHLAGNETQIHLCRAISESLRETALLVRYGGDELVALMTGPIFSQAPVVTERISSLVDLQSVYLESENSQQVTISIGMYNGARVRQ